MEGFTPSFTSCLLVPTISSAARTSLLDEEELSFIESVNRTSSWRAKPAEVRTAAVPLHHSSCQLSPPKQPSSLSVSPWKGQSSTVAARTRSKTTQTYPFAPNPATKVLNRSDPKRKVFITNLTSTVSVEGVITSPSAQQLKFNQGTVSFKVSPPLRGIMEEQCLPPSSPLSRDDSAGKGKEAEPEWALQSGMENGYALSPIGALRIKYNQDAEMESSLFIRSKLIISKTDLEITDVLDCGLNKLNAAIPHFCLEMGLRMRVETTVRDMQLLMIKAAALIEGHLFHFLVDPHNLLVTTLRGGGSLAELSIAWSALLARLTLAQKYFEKYDKEYQARSHNELLLSPVSTVSSLYNGMSAPRSNGENLTYL
ncbi:hypothetical protein C8J57DRAFT_1258278 [Mycena rebaudengoi]|nr:hypothetical protein C8J57DRAFT_1258278 [Mycena rebaudengoi]